VSVPVLTAITGTSWEAALVANLQRTATGIAVVRRCVDLADLLAVAATGTARAVLLSADLRRLDRLALARLAAARVVVVGLVAPGDVEAEQRLRSLGVRHVLPADAPPATISAAVTSALTDTSGVDGARSFGDPSASFPDVPPAAGPGLEGDAGLPADGKLVAVWGPAGSPGRTSIALGVATELAAFGVPTLLADGDVYGGVVAQLLGFLDEAPGLAAVCRLANNGQLDLPALARLAPVAAPGLRVLTGISRAARWSELRPSSLEQVWTLARSLSAVTIVDCGFALEQDEELSFDTAAPRRNGATLQTLEQADVVLAVGAADPVGVQRLLRGLSELRDAVPGAVPRVVLNRLRRSAVGPDPEGQLSQACERFAGVRDISFIPYDRQAFDDAIRQGRSLVEVAPDSPARRALAALAASIVGRPAPPRRRRLVVRST
jgi:Flp pilus assembly CpaE family ATPase